MKTNRIHQALLAALAICALTGSSQAGHIDELGLGASLVSSTGTGTFVVKFTEFMGSNGWMWSGSSWTGTYNIPFTVTSFVGPGTLSPMSGSGTGVFEGLVNSAGVPTAGFGASQINTQYVNNLNDAARYSFNQTFTITGFNPTASYSVSVTMTDCCFVSQGGTPTFNGTLVIDPTQVVHEHNHGVPDGGTTVAMLGFALSAMAGVRRFFRA